HSWRPAASDPSYTLDCDEPLCIQESAPLKRFERTNRDEGLLVQLGEPGADLLAHAICPFQEILPLARTMPVRVGDHLQHTCPDSVVHAVREPAGNSSVTVVSDVCEHTLAQTLHQISLWNSTDIAPVRASIAMIRVTCSLLTSVSNSRVSQTFPGRRLSPSTTRTSPDAASAY